METTWGVVLTVLGALNLAGLVLVGWSSEQTRRLLEAVLKRAATAPRRR